jgi:rhodanese-related sulfurtransferase
MEPLTLEAVLALQAAGAQILDTREPVEFAAAHLMGSINIALSGSYATWAGTVLDHEHPIVIIADPGRETEAAVRLGRIGFDHIAGHLADGMRSLASYPELTASTTRVSAPFAAEILSSNPPPLVIDVRTPQEHQQRHIAGSRLIPLNHLVESMDSLPKDRPLLVYCAAGYRSAIGASLLQRHGFDRVSEIASGIEGWQAARLPVEV